MADFLYKHVSEQLHNEIRGMATGTRLPSERAMSQKYGVSRNVLRESLRLLSEKGVLEIVPGKGVYVADKSEKRFAKKLEDMLLRSDSSLLDIVEVREGLETAVFLQAVDKATNEDIDRLIQIQHRMEHCQQDITLFNQLDMQFHIELARCTKNSVYPILVSAFYEITDKKLFLITQLYPVRVFSAIREHKALIDALRERDKKAVVEIARKHFYIGDILSGEIKNKQETFQKNL